MYWHGWKSIYHYIYRVFFIWNFWSLFHLKIGVYFLSCFFTYRTQLFKVDLDSFPIKLLDLYLSYTHFCKRAVGFIFERAFYFCKPLWSMKFAFWLKIFVCYVWVLYFYPVLYLTCLCIHHVLYLKRARKYINISN